ncbi:MAG TPA: hypothetical protein DIT28_12310 [Oxalobacteraceae bacterium]|nr:hypothetical protein [Oxalobacteraceae bacterium]
MVKQYPPLTVALIALCVAVALLSQLGASQEVLQYLYIADPHSEGLAAVGNGQVWRLLTPIFIHFGIMHLVFNMMWLWDLGGLIEAKKGSWFLGGFTLAVGIPSNLAQYLLGGSPFFGGMSGVVYGLLGYIWMQGRYNPRFGHVLHKSTVVMMLAWFVLCWTGLLGPIANWAHSASLLIGVAWGYLERNKSPARIVK